MSKIQTEEDLIKNIADKWLQYVKYICIKLLIFFKMYSKSLFNWVRFLENTTLNMTLLTLI